MLTLTTLPSDAGLVRVGVRAIGLGLGLGLGFGFGFAFGLGLGFGFGFGLPAQPAEGALVQEAREVA